MTAVAFNEPQSYIHPRLWAFFPDFIRDEMKKLGQELPKLEAEISRYRDQVQRLNANRALALEKEKRQRAANVEALVDDPALATITPVATATLEFDGALKAVRTRLAMAEHAVSSAKVRLGAYRMEGLKQAAKTIYTQHFVPAAQNLQDAAVLIRAAQDAHGDLLHGLHLGSMEVPALTELSETGAQEYSLRKVLAVGHGMFLTPLANEARETFERQLREFLGCEVPR